MIIKKVIIKIMVKIKIINVVKIYRSTAGKEVIEMARRRAIEADELFETANRLQAEGKEVTAVALLDALGGGSLRTIYKHLEVWQQRRPAVVITTPEEIPGQVQASFANAWRLASQEAARAVQAVKEKAAEEVQAAQAQFQGALDEIGKLEAESEADAQQIDSLKQRVAELESALQKSQNDGAAYKATVEQLRHQVKSQEAELERLHGEIDKERTTRQQEIQRITAASEAAQGKAEQQIESLKKTISEEQSKSQQLEKEKADAHTRRDETQRQLEKVEEASKADRAERDAAIKDAAELRGLSEGLKAQNAELLSRIGRDDKDKSRKG
ncbi:MAG: DNA-binding protein [Cyanobacteria bacterium REEB67]|nr:DNA-binding protein [Cyanobacteria bacterium REEB67]